MIVRLSKLARPYLYVDLTLTDAGLPVNPSILPVRLALPAAGVDPVSGDWADGEWEHQHDGSWSARILVGPAGTLTPPPGSRDLWIQVSNDPELLVENTGRVVFE
jgi:hypothetical protein